MIYFLSRNHFMFLNWAQDDFKLDSSLFSLLKFFILKIEELEINLSRFYELLVAVIAKLIERRAANSFKIDCDSYYFHFQRVEIRWVLLMLWLMMIFVSIFNQKKAFVFPDESTYYCYFKVQVNVYLLAFNFSYCNLLILNYLTLFLHCELRSTKKEAYQTLSMMLISNDSIYLHNYLCRFDFTLFLIFNFVLLYFFTEVMVQASSRALSYPSKLGFKFKPII